MEDNNLNFITNGNSRTPTTCVNGLRTLNVPVSPDDHDNPNFYDVADYTEPPEEETVDYYDDFVEIDWHEYYDTAWAVYRIWLEQDWDEFVSWYRNQRSWTGNFDEVESCLEETREALNCEYYEEDIRSVVRNVCTFYVTHMESKRIETAWSALRERMQTNPTDFEEMVADVSDDTSVQEFRGFINGTIEVDKYKAYGFKSRIFWYYENEYPALRQRRTQEAQMKWIDFRPQLFYDNQRRALFYKIDLSKIIPAHADEFVAMVDGAFTAEEYYDWFDEGLPREQELTGAVLAFYDREEFWWDDYRTAPLNPSAAAGSGAIK